MSDMELFRDSTIGSHTQCVDPGAGAARTIRAVITDLLRIPFTDGGTAATATVEHSIWYVTFRCRLATGLAPGGAFSGGPPAVQTITLLPKVITGVAVTADATNNLVATIGRKRAAGATVDVAQYTSNVAGGSTALWTPKDLAIIGDNQFEVGDTLTFRVAKGGTGVAHSSATVASMLELLLEKN